MRGAKPERTRSDLRVREIKIDLFFFIAHPFRVSAVTFMEEPNFGEITLPADPPTSHVRRPALVFMRGEQLAAPIPSNATR